ncbi:MAG: prevent-host-death protein [Acidobacteria bacterium]|nr:MAG: prevent-host-death protein [Acidobacteriota bacterium]REK06099.1 MAG: prevent-host-death protein [Acidobacteriota bacterium]
MWKIAEAKKHLSRLVAAAQRQPQRLYRRDELVAVVVAPEEFLRFEAWQARERRSVGELTAEIREIAAEESYELPPVERVDRETDVADERATP